ncbi:hypothetical protein QGP82_04980 [Leptothoe sp. LEGE 181152]|nr:hypothetical protein [Leptothoe sp. LEGE 181152]
MVKHSTLPTVLVAGSNEHPLMHESQQVLHRTLAAAQSYPVSHN